MASGSLESLLEERVAQLKAISERRNVLLREMYQMMQRRQKVGSIFSLEDQDEDGVGVFLDKFDLDKNPETGSIENLLEFELFSPEEESPETAEEVHADTPPSDDIAKAVDNPQGAELPNTDMQVDEDDSPFPSPAHLRRSSSKQSDGESEDILLLSVSECARSGSRPRTHVHTSVDRDQEQDELDLIDSPSSSLARAVSEQVQTQDTTPTEPSRDDTMEPINSTVVDEVVVDTSSVGVIKESEYAGEDIPYSQEQHPTELEYQPEDVVMSSAREYSSIPEARSPKLAPPVLLAPRVLYVPTIPETSMQAPLLVPAPSSPIHELPFSFDQDVDVKPTIYEQPLSSTQPHHFDPHYTLPPLKMLPAEFHRKGKLTKQQRRREKERERGPDRADIKKDDWVPMGLNKWNATLNANPVWKRVSRANKCLSTREWNVAMSELKIIRTLERVETLKDAGRWSFRQPKKQRGVGGLTKTHWDYLMDEMKWMRVDFREERKWKIALAYNLATAVLQWHDAGSVEERIRRGICVLWRKPRPLEDTEDLSADTGDAEMEAENSTEEPKQGALSMVDYGSDDEDQDADQQDVTDALETTTAIQDALDGVDSAARSETQDDVDTSERIQPKLEDLEDSSALRGGDAEASAMDLDVSQTSSENKKIEEEDGTITFGLKPTSIDPVLGDNSGSNSKSHSTHASSESAAPTKSKANPYAPLRESIAYSDEQKLFLDWDDFSLVKGISSLSTADKPLEVHLPPPDLSAIFPDLQPLVLLDVAPPPPNAPEGKKKSEKRSDRDDPNKRAEETTYTKLTSFGRFMHCKPTLLGPLQPAKRWENGKWSNLEDTVISVEFEPLSNKSLDEYMSDLFEGNKPGSSPAVNGALLPVAPKDPRKRVPEHAWSTTEDALLKSLVERYPNNWSLISDAFNSSRVTISTDKRTPWDCLERWSQKWGSGTRLAAQAIPQDLASPAPLDANTPPPVIALPLPVPAQMTTRGVKRLASASIGGNGGSGEPKKRRRHNLMLDTIRKASKKKEAAQKANLNQRKPAAIHDTHGQYNKMPKLTPAELSRMKAEKEARDAQELMLARRRHEDLARAQMAHRMQPQQQGALLQQAQQASNGTARPPTAGLPTAQGVPQIRAQVNISQQQRLPTPMTANARMSPQQMMQAQVAQARAISAQGHVQPATPNVNGNGPHIPYGSRADTSSPAVSQGSPPHNAATTPSITNANSPRPPSAASLPPSQQQGVAQPMGAHPRPANLPHFFPPVTSTQFTPEQMEQAMRLQNIIQAQHRQV